LNGSFVSKNSTSKFSQYKLAASVKSGVDYENITNRKYSEIVSNLKNLQMKEMSNTHMSNRTCVVPHADMSVGFEDRRLK